MNNEWKKRLLKMKEQNRIQKIRLENNKKAEKPKRYLPFNPIFNNATDTDTDNDDDIRKLEKLKKNRNELKR